MRVKEPTPELLAWCEGTLVLPNPDFAKKERMGLWTGNTPRTITLYERIGTAVIIPFGCVQKLMLMFPEYLFWSHIKPSKAFSVSSNINLYPYQEEAVKKALNVRNGVIVMPCGSGKTQTALEIIARLGVPTLWLTHTQDLLNQSMTRAKSVLNCGGYGTITGGKVNVGTGITFATVQTMARIDLTELKDSFGCIVVDECHKAIGSPTKVMQFYKVLSSLSCRYKFGLTATPKRADGLERSMFALIGDVIHEVSKQEVKDTTCPVFVRQIETGYVPDMDIALAGDGTLNYAGLVDDMTQDKERREVVLWEIEARASWGAMLVLTNRVKYAQELSDAFSGRSVCLSTLGNSKAGKAARKEALRKLNDGELDAVFATYQLAKEGLDVPNLRTVVFATPEKDPTTVEQSAGRVGRKYPGKDCGVVLDFVDDFGMLRGWAKKRANLYKKLDFILEDDVAK